MRDLWDARQYAENSSLQKSYADTLLAAIQLRGQERILDLGCGDGRLTAALSRRVPHGSVLGVDISPEMTAYARARFNVAEYPNLAFETGNASELKREREFDLITSFSMLHWVKDQMDALRRMRHALREHGQVLLMLYAKNQLLWDQVNAATRSAEWAPLFSGYEDPWYAYDEESYTRHLTEAGFQVEFVRMSAPHVVEFRSPKEFYEYAEGWLTPARWVPTDRRKAFVASSLSGYLDQLPRSVTGGYQHSVCRVEAFARLGTRAQPGSP
jgi:trans-aconitate methyltransferase